MATLKISDISVGDWVRVINQFDAQIDGYHSESGSLSLKTRQRHLVHYRLEDIRPIPITPEILEANGFEEDWGVWYNSEVRMEFERYIDGWARTVNCGEYRVYFIKYVHQLQHALRLAGVDKEIVMPNK